MSLIHRSISALSNELLLSQRSQASRRCQGSRWIARANSSRESLLWSTRFSNGTNSPSYTLLYRQNFWRVHRIETEPEYTKGGPFLWHAAHQWKVVAIAWSAARLQRSCSCHHSIRLEVKDINSKHESACYNANISSISFRNRKSIEI